MPTIAEAVKSNEQFKAKFPEVEPVSIAPVNAAEFPLMTSQPPANLPVRGGLPPNLVIGTDFYTTVRQFRNNGRSSVMIPPVAVSKSNTPQSLINKKLISPTVGGGSPLNRYNSLVATVNPAAVSANTTVTQTFTVAGISPADKVIGFQWTTAQNIGVTVLAVRVTGFSTIAIDFFNPTAGSLTPTGGGITLFLVQ